MDQIQHKNILRKLDEFIRKYYKNQLIRGAFYAIGLSLICFLSAVLFEYLGEFGSNARMFLFFSWLFSTAAIIGWFAIVPLCKLYRLGTIISYNQAAEIIGKHFTSVQDKLLNYLQLTKQSGEDESSALLQASIQQRILELNPIPFSSAIRFSENKKYMKWVLIPFVFLLFLLLGAPSIVTESTRRLIHYEKHFVKPAPFKFELLNKNLRAVQQDDFTIDLKISGNELPAEVYVETTTGIVRLEKEKNNLFHYTFKNLQADLRFYFSANGFSSEEYELKVLSKPSLADFSIQLDYPNYTGKKDETVNNIGDLLIPQGTKVLWTFSTKNSNLISLRFTDTLFNLSPRPENKFSFSKTFLRGGNYFIRPMNDDVRNGDSISYVVNVVPDAYPVIELNQQQDSLHPKNIYFSGSVKDDYGFTSLKFNYVHYSVDSSGAENQKQQSSLLRLVSGQTLQPFYYFFDLNTLPLKPGDRVEYYFEVFDNDAVNGAKSSRTKTMIFTAPTLDELNKESSKNNASIEKNMEEALKEAKALQNQISDISRQLQEKKQMSWEDKKKLEDLMNRQQDLKNKIENFKNQNDRNNEMRNEFSPPSQEMMDKQEELEKLMENIMTPELQKLFEELQKLMEKMSDKQKIQETLDKLKLSDKDMEKELDRNLELFKQMDVEQRLDNAIKKLDELQKQQEELSTTTNPDKKAEEKLLNEKKEQVKNQLDELKRQEEKLKNDGVENKEQQQALAEKSNELKKQLEDLKRRMEENKHSQQKSEDLKKQQESLTEKFNDLKNDLKDLEKKNQELENPNQLPDMNQIQQQISNDQKNAEQQLNQNDKKGSSKSQKSAADKMQDMQNMMEMAQQQMSQEQEGEDIAAIRQLLENLLHMSFEQEGLMAKTKKSKSTDPNFTQLGQAQHRLKEEVKKVEDTLLAISKRQPKISSEVNREINSIQMNMSKTISALEDRMVYDASTRQQNIMTSINNLALMLNESLDQLQQQAAQKKGGSPGGGSCKKPGGTGQKPSMGNMRKMQESLNKQLQEMKNAMEKGGQKPGQKKGQGGTGGLSPEQFAKAAAQQEALRRMYQEAMKNMKDGGKNPGGNLANMMEETENELVNKVISQQTLFRQQEILTRLLESEKAEQQREMDEKRQSNESKDTQISNQNSFLEYKRLKEKELELLKTVPPNLNPYYKEKVNDYFNNYIK